MLDIGRCRYWTNDAGTVERIYVKTYPDTRTYYDIRKRKWYSDACPSVIDIREEVLRSEEVTDEDELVRMVKLRQSIF